MLSVILIRPTLNKILSFLSKQFGICLTKKDCQLSGGKKICARFASMLCYLLRYYLIFQTMPEFRYQCIHVYHFWLAVYMYVRMGTRNIIVRTMG